MKKHNYELEKLNLSYRPTEEIREKFTKPR